MTKICHSSISVSPIDIAEMMAEELYSDSFYLDGAIKVFNDNKRYGDIDEICKIFNIDKHHMMTVKRKKEPHMITNKILSKFIESAIIYYKSQI